MAKIYLDYNSLNNALYDLDRILEKLKDSVYGIGYLSIPYEFEYASYLKKIFNINLDTYNKLLNKRNNVQNLIDGFKSVENKNITNIQSIQSVSLSYRNKIIN